jgi:hypothetical protein
MKHLDYHMWHVGKDLEAGGRGMQNIEYQHLLELNHLQHQWQCKLQNFRCVRSGISARTGLEPQEWLFFFTPKDLFQAPSRQFHSIRKKTRRCRSKRQKQFKRKLKNPFPWIQAGIFRLCRNKWIHIFTEAILIRGSFQKFCTLYVFSLKMNLRGLLRK